MEASALPVIVVTGPPCAGKSSAVAAMAPATPQEGELLAIVDLDAVRWQVRGGRLNPMDEIPPSQAAVAQWQLAVDICGDMVRRYVDRGYAVVVDAPGIYADGVVPWGSYTHSTWVTLLAGVRWKLVVLLPDIEVVCERAIGRQGFRQPPESILRAIHEFMQPWRSVDGVAVLDSTSLSVEDTAAAIWRLAGSEG